MNGNKMYIEYDEVREQLKVYVTHQDEELYLSYYDEIEHNAIEIMHAIEDYYVEYVIVSSFVAKYRYYDYVDIDYLAFVMGANIVNGDNA